MKKTGAQAPVFFWRERGGVPGALRMIESLPTFAMAGIVGRFFRAGVKYSFH